MRFIRACRAAGVEDFSLHDLRHTYASHLKMNGADLYDIQKLLGHSDPRMTQRYAHLGQDHLDAAASRLDGVLSLPAPEGKQHAAS
jgi:site-specific recombinase XerD